ncbi:MAG: acyl-CoA synthetase FdrA [Chloroflexi bacterium]|nr:acyl-CoA synthetase FdrA [Chloroflexota bacterium]
MTATLVDIRRGAYYDSAFLMQLQRTLSDLPGVQDAGVIMGTPTNKELLAAIDLLPPEAQSAKPDDLLIVVRAEDETAARDALARVDDLLTRKQTAHSAEYRPQSLETAAAMLPDAAWVLVSVAGRYAAVVARNALRLGKHVFLFSDNVPVEEEIKLKAMAAAKGLLVMGPDCGTALIRGIGLGFANKVRLGPIGVVAAAGTGLQQVTARIHQLGGGVSHGIGTGGRDLTEKVGAATFKQGIDVLARDPDTKVIVLVSKPPAPKVAEEMLQLARSAPKPVVINFIGRPASTWQMDNLYFATGLDDAARLAVELANDEGRTTKDGGEPAHLGRFAPSQRYLRGLFSGGTLAYEAQYILQGYLPKVWANAPLDKADRIPNSLVSQEHTIIDLGEDEFTVGRLHPMMDNELRIRRLMQEAADPETAVIMLDVVIGYGSHPNPASELAPAIAKAKATAAAAGRTLEVVAVVTGTDEDPQNFGSQIEQLRAAGAWVNASNEAVVRYAGRILRALNPQSAIRNPQPPIDLATLQRPLSAINVGLESFAENLIAQGVPAIQVDWRPPAGGNEKLMMILERMKGN